LPVNHAQLLREVARVLVPGRGVAVLLTKDTQLMERVLRAPWARESFTAAATAAAAGAVTADGSQSSAAPGMGVRRPRMVLIGGMRAALYRLQRSAAPWSALAGGGAIGGG
jgi:hypothetical protein